MPSSAAPLSPPPLVVAAPPFTVGATLSRSFSAWWQLLPAIVALSLAFELPVLAIAARTATSELGDSTSTFQTFLSSVLAAGSAGGITHAVLAWLGGRRAGLGELFGVAVRKWLLVFLASLGMGLAALLGTILFVVPGVIALCGLWLAVPALVAEPLTANDSLRRSWSLTEGARLRILAVGAVSILVFLGAIFVAGALLVIGEPVLSTTATAVLEEALGTVLIAFPTVTAAVAYHDLRAEKEGVPGQDLARVFE